MSKGYFNNLLCEMITQEYHSHKHLQCSYWVALHKLLLDKLLPISILQNTKIHITVRSFPMLHLALISKNGTVWDVSLNEKTSPSKKYLFKLPKSCSYHGYCDDKGILNFIAGHLDTEKVDFKSYHKNRNQYYILLFLQKPFILDECKPPKQNLKFSMQDYDIFPFIQFEITWTGWINLIFFS